jgi:hypothetical protein
MNFYKIGTILLILVITIGLFILVFDKGIIEVWIFSLMPILVLVLAFVLYFLPSIVAYNQKHHNADAICVLNLLLGWTFLGWVIALVWAVTKKPNQN